ncbi:hypothetical protein FA95DRAFT_1603686 [Auriscalpium vulgare]|uniref:Uncharacterized protein n=1 Tax=Auriscalpium vulgare TaxID=40419 RepID=A0ACB8S2P1_9AGAM|nr:hypothetical protein FA95DRAFT_1603686 [Auriscalpium vulgare]
MSARQASSSPRPDVGASAKWNSSKKQPNAFFKAVSRKFHARAHNHRPGPSSATTGRASVPLRNSFIARQDATLQECGLLLSSHPTQAARDRSYAILEGRRAPVDAESRRIADTSRYVRTAGRTESSARDWEGDGSSSVLDISPGKLDTAPAREDAIKDPPSLKPSSAASAEHGTSENHDGPEGDGQPTRSSDDESGFSLATRKRRDLQATAAHDGPSPSTPSQGRRPSPLAVEIPNTSTQPAQQPAQHPVQPVSSPRTSVASIPHLPPSPSDEYNPLREQVELVPAPAPRKPQRRRTRPLPAVPTAQKQNARPLPRPLPRLDDDRRPTISLYLPDSEMRSPSERGPLPLIDPSLSPCTPELSAPLTTASTSPWSQPPTPGTALVDDARIAAPPLSTSQEHDHAEARPISVPGHPPESSPAPFESSPAPSVAEESSLPTQFRLQPNRRAPDNQRRTSMGAFSMKLTGMLKVHHALSVSRLRRPRAYTESDVTPQPLEKTEEAQEAQKTPTDGERNKEILKKLSRTYGIPTEHSFTD